jgi:hypothetical protein
MKERGNYETMRKAARLYTKEIRVIEVIERDHFDHDWGGRAHSARSPVLAGSSWPEVLPRVVELGDGRHREPCQASAVTRYYTQLTNLAKFDDSASIKKIQFI